MPDAPSSPAPGATAGDDLALALGLADLADRITMSRFRAEDLIVETKPDLTPVSEADRAVEQAVRERLAEARPGDVVLGEEYGGEEPPAGGRRWIIDPIDGTKGYVRGLPVWATLLALERDGAIVLGVVSAPALGRRWWGGPGRGAWGRELAADGDGAARALRVSRVAALEDAQLCYGGLEEWRQAGRLEALLALGERCWRTRGYGDFWSYMLVAEGAAEIGLDPSVSLWDLAAPMAVVQGAGGRFTDLSGAVTAAGGSGVATNGLLHETALELLNR